jgi:GT2 family glycosyltransferase
LQEKWYELENPVSGWYLIEVLLDKPIDDLRASANTVGSNESSSEQLLTVTLKGLIRELIYVPVDSERLEFSWQCGLIDKPVVSSLKIQSISNIKRLYFQLRRVVGVASKQPYSRLKKAGFKWHLFFSDFQKIYRIINDFRASSLNIPYSHWIELNEKLTEHDNKLISTQSQKLYSVVSLYIVIEDSLYVSFRDEIKNSSIFQVDTVLSKSEFLSMSPQFKEQKWFVFVDSAVELQKYALYWIATVIKNNKSAQLIYSDHDFIDEHGKRKNHFFKPDWSRELFLASNYVGPVIAVKWSQNLQNSIDVMLNECYIDSKLDGYMIGLALLENSLKTVNTIQDVFYHIPAVLYHQFLSFKASASFSCLESFLNRHNIYADIMPVEKGLYKICYQATEYPLVSVIVPTKDGLNYLRPCIESLLKNTEYPRFEIIVVNNCSEEDETLAYLEHLATLKNVRVLNYQKAFNFSAINNFAATYANGDLMCLLNNDTEVINADWLDRMVGQLQQPNVGVVGAKLLFANNTVQHIGDAVGPGGCADHFHSGIDSDDYGYGNRAVVANEVSAVTAACLLTTKQIYSQVNGLDEVNLAVNFNDVDFCLRVAELGYRIVMTPCAKLYHYESVSRGKDITPQKAARAKRESNYMKRVWKKRLLNDPFYNPNLNYSRPNFRLNHAPMVDKPWQKPSIIDKLMNSIW